MENTCTTVVASALRRQRGESSHQLGQELLGHNRQWSLQSIPGSTPGQSTSVTSMSTYLLTKGLRRLEARNHRGRLNKNYGPSSTKGEDPYLFQRQSAIQVTYSQQSESGVSCTQGHECPSLKIGLLDTDWGVVVEWVLRGRVSTGPPQRGSGVWGSLNQ